jgi:hypothetical protein
VIDGPFTETKELVGGFWLIQVKSREGSDPGSGSALRAVAREQRMHDEVAAQAAKRS